MKRFGYIVVLSLVLWGCGTKKKAVTPEQPSVPEVPSWRTCVIQNAHATAIRGGDRLASQITMQTVRDSMIVISVMPMFGMEMLRVEATPLLITAIDKIHGQYAQATYAEVNRLLTPSLNWDVLQQLCSAELPTGAEKARLVYTFGDEQIELVVDYTPRRLDVPVRMNSLRTNKYKKIDISQWL
ncbi:MAG: DUF4292 domain-containing protein [Paludibacteraceae bacterium]|nr:DUF4292 domain-containing protein [Paludibacteraceae bacterium]MBQ6763730.1 DUF4292 domain-containing protein [Paludibacteraceae bacterium]